MKIPGPTFVEGGGNFTPGGKAVATHMFDFVGKQWADTVLRVDETSP